MSSVGSATSRRHADIEFVLALVMVGGEDGGGGRVLLTAQGLRRLQAEEVARPAVAEQRHGDTSAHKSRPSPHHVLATSNTSHVLQQRHADTSAHGKRGGGDRRRGSGGQGRPHGMCYACPRSASRALGRCITARWLWVKARFRSWSRHAQGTSPRCRVGGLASLIISLVQRCVGVV